MTVSVEVVADSIGAETGKRITTLVGRLPRNIHAEFMTHRAFGRNASSSRAIPMERMHRSIQEDPAYPERWTLNEPGMQGYQDADAATIQEAKYWVGQHREYSIAIAERLAALGLHKQIVNRYTEAHQHIRVVFTSTEWDNFLLLRTHPTAEPTMQEVGRCVGEALQESEPTPLERDQWHLPYFNEEEFNDLVNDNNIYEMLDLPEFLVQQFPPYAGKRALRVLGRIAVSAARCARTSYNNFEGKRSGVEEDIALFNKLIVSQPIHASPLEHQACPDWLLPVSKTWMNPHLHGNLVGWRQARKFIPGEDGRSHAHHFAP